MEFSTERLQEFAVRAHQNAVEKGWWDGEDRDNREIMALVHSELSEALEEYRSGHGMVWFNDIKPEGIAVELIDAVIRICDFMEHRELSFVQTGERKGESEMELPVFVAFLHAFVGALIWDCNLGWTDGKIRDREEVERYLSEVCYTIYQWLEARKLDMFELLELKHTYNQTRPYRHGGKVC